MLRVLNYILTSFIFILSVLFYLGLGLRTLKVHIKFSFTLSKLVECILFMEKHARL